MTRTLSFAHREPSDLVVRLAINFCAARVHAAQQQQPFEPFELWSRSTRSPTIDSSLSISDLLDSSHEFFD
jgi:hypothetical protein